MSYWIRYDRYDKYDRGVSGIASGHAGPGSGQRATARGIAESVRQERDDREAFCGFCGDQLPDAVRMVAEATESGRRPGAVDGRAQESSMGGGNARRREQAPAAARPDPVPC